MRQILHNLPMPYLQYQTLHPHTVRVFEPLPGTIEDPQSRSAGYPGNIPAAADSQPHLPANTPDIPHFCFSCNRASNFQSHFHLSIPKCLPNSHIDCSQSAHTGFWQTSFFRIAPAGNTRRKTCLFLSHKADSLQSSEASFQPDVPHSGTEKNTASARYIRGLS